MSNHVAQHLHPNRPRLSPTIPPKHLNPATTIERLRQHLPAPSRALRQPHPRLLLRTVRTIELSRNLQVRSRKPYPLSPNIVYMRKDRRNSPDLARRFSSPRVRIKTLNKNLVHPIISSKHPDRRSTNLSMNLLSTHGPTSTSCPTAPTVEHPIPCTLHPVPSPTLKPAKLPPDTPPASDRRSPASSPPPSPVPPASGRKDRHAAAATFVPPRCT